jgi:hypothetical protein
MLINESISKGDPDYSYLVIRQNYLEQLETTPPLSEMLKAWADVVFSFGDGHINNKVARLNLDIQIILNKMLLTKNEDLKYLIDDKKRLIENETQRQFNIEDFYDNCTQISINLGVNFVPFQTTTRQYFGYVKELNRRANLIKLKNNGKK